HTNLVLMKRHALITLLLSFFFLCCLLLGHSQEEKTPSKKQPNSSQESTPISILSQWQEGTSYFKQISFTLDADGKYSIKHKPLEDAATLKVLADTKVILSRTNISGKKGKEETLKIEIKDIPSVGLYESEIQVLDSTSKVVKTFPLKVSLLNNNLLSILGAESGLKVKMARASWLNFNGLLPGSKHQEKFYIRLENKSDYELHVSSVSFKLIGIQSLQSVTEKDFIIEAEQTLAPHSEAVVKMELKKGVYLDPDEYTGTLRVNLAELSQNLPINFNLKTKSSAFWALVLLLLGVIVGYMIRQSNSSEAQFELMDRYVVLKDQINEIPDAPTQESLNKELKALLGRIEKVTDESSKKQVENDFPKLETKVVQIESLMKMLTDAKSRLEHEKRKGDISRVFTIGNQINQKILQGDIDTLDEDLGKIKQIVLKGSNSRSLDPNATEEDVEEAKKSMDIVSQKFDQLGSDLKEPKIITQGGAEAETGIWARIKKGFFKILAFFTGVETSAMVKYGLFRPIASLTVFILVLLGGFYELYVKGGDTFGMEGLYDYLKLFLWGIISNVFSAKLTDNTLVSSLTTKTTNS
ncbi:MAG: hypothetical protein AAF696_20510, partial [Bacteroidota bacterium]